MSAKNYSVRVPTDWDTHGGHYCTTAAADITFSLPEFDPSKSITWHCYVDTRTDPHLACYDMIMGHDLQSALGLDIKWSTHEIK